MSEGTDLGRYQTIVLRCTTQMYFPLLVEIAELFSVARFSLNALIQPVIVGCQEKMEQTQQSSHQLITTLQDELAQVSAFKDELQKYIRELEQTNDDLERTKR